MNTPARPWRALMVLLLALAAASLLGAIWLPGAAWKWTATAALLLLGSAIAANAADDREGTP